MAQAVRSLSPKQIQERMQQHRQAVGTFARLAAKKAVQDNLRAQGVRVSLFPIYEIIRQAREYLDNHPELYQQALERAQRLGYVNRACVMKWAGPKRASRQSVPRPEWGLPCPVMATATLALSQGSMAYSRHNRLGNDDPDLVRHLGGWGTEDRGRALAGRTGRDLSKPDGGVNGSR